MTLRGKDFTFDADAYEAETFIGEVLRAEHGVFPVKKRDPETNDLITVEVPAIQTEIENLSRIMPFNYVETYEDKRGARSKITFFQRAYQSLGINSLTALKEQRYFEYERKRLVLGTRSDGSEIVLIFNRPIRKVSYEEAEAVRRARDLAGVEAEEEPEVVAPPMLTDQQVYLLSIMDKKTPLAVINTAKDDPVISADKKFLNDVISQKIQKELERMGRVKLVEGRYQVIEG